MKRRSGVLFILFVLPFFLGMAVEEEEAHSSSVMGYVGKVFNFFVLFGGLFFLLRKPLVDFLERRGREIDSSIQESILDRQKMEDRLKESSGRLAQLAEEIQEIRTNAQEEGKRRKEQILKDAEKETRKIREWRRQEIDHYHRAKIRELKARTAEWATVLAQRSIEEKMTPERHVYLLDRSISRLEDIYEK
jgi:F-type H+-transporting ATPase subunit b